MPPESTCSATALQIQAEPKHWRTREMRSTAGPFHNFQKDPSALRAPKEGKNRPAELAQKEVGTADVVLQLGDDRRGAVDHHQAKTDQGEYGEEKDPICF